MRVLRLGSSGLSKVASWVSAVASLVFSVSRSESMDCVVASLGVVGSEGSMVMRTDRSARRSRWCNLSEDRFARGGGWLKVGGAFAMEAHDGCEVVGVDGFGVWCAARLWVIVSRLVVMDDSLAVESDMIEALVLWLVQVASRWSLDLAMSLIRWLMEARIFEDVLAAIALARDSLREWSMERAMARME